MRLPSVMTNLRANALKIVQPRCRDREVQPRCRDKEGNPQVSDGHHIALLSFITEGPKRCYAACAKCLDFPLATSALIVQDSD